jgi:hypothetical protein
MPIQINLLAETQAAEAMRRRDPVKRTIFAGISLAIIFLAWGGLVEMQVLLAKAQVAAVEQKIDLRTNNFQTATANMQKISAATEKIAALDKLQQARFLQGNLLDALQHATVDGVQLTQLRLSQSYSTTQKEGTKGKPGPTVCQEDISLRLDARDFSANPGDQVNKFISTIANAPYFETMLGPTNSVRLVGPPSSPQTGAETPYVTFAVECKFPPKTR